MNLTEIRVVTHKYKSTRNMIIELDTGSGTGSGTTTSWLPYSINSGSSVAPCLPQSLRSPTSPQSKQPHHPHDQWRPWVDYAIISLEQRFDQYKQYEDISGFLLTTQKLKSLNTNQLKASCKNLEMFLQNGDILDIDADDFFNESELLQKIRVSSHRFEPDKYPKMKRPGTDTGTGQPIDNHQHSTPLATDGT
ncbi:hypothetical protein LXL04_038489 [Taraxacum kok-saghyz]